MGIRKMFAAPYVDEVLLFEKAKAIIENSTRQEFRQKAEACTDLDLATTLMYEYVSRENKTFIDHVNNYDISQKPANKDIKIIVAPGMFYKEHPEVGSRGDIVCEIAGRCGFESTILPLSSKGSVANNTKLLVDAIKNESHKNVWLVSFSKGSAEVRHSVEELLGSAEISKVRGWISISGMPHGSPLATLKQQNFLSKSIWSATSKCLGVETAISKELAHENDYLKSPVKIGGNFNLVHIVGFPLPSHIHPELIKFYKRLTPFGPNDGLVSLNDFMSVSGHVYPIWGADHFLRTGIISSLIYKMCHYISYNKMIYEKNS